MQLIGSSRIVGVGRQVFFVELKLCLGVCVWLCVCVQPASSRGTPRWRCTSRSSCPGAAASSWTAGRAALTRKSPSSLTASP